MPALATAPGPCPFEKWENLRKVDVIVRHEQWGTISFGQGSMASDGAAEVDLSGVGNTYVGIADTAGGFEFRRIGTDMLSGVSIGDAFKAFDGNGRKGRVRYDTPTIAGFTVSASWGKEVLKRNRDEEFRDVALWYANEFPNGAELEAKLAWFQEDKSGTKSSGVAGSASLFLPSGLNFTIAAADKGAPSYIYGKIGYTRMFWEVGSTSFAVDYYHGKDYALMGGATTSNSKAWGAGVTQKFDEYNLEGYLSYRHHSFEDNMASYHEIGQ